MSTKDTNPKDAIGCKKLPMDLVPTTGIEEESLAFLEGALKYGKFNWRISGVSASIYIAAIKRHLAKFENGEDRARDTDVHHLASIRACCNIILDAALNGMLNDDRPPVSDNSRRIDELTENVTHLQKMFKDHHPHQYTIGDVPGDTGRED